jgi:hypothetical protein
MLRSSPPTRRKIRDRRFVTGISRRCEHRVRSGCHYVTVANTTTPPETAGRSRSRPEAAALDQDFAGAGCVDSPERGGSQESCRITSTWPRRRAKARHETRANRRRLPAYARRNIPCAAARRNVDRDTLQSVAASPVLRISSSGPATLSRLDAIAVRFVVLPTSIRDVVRHAPEGMGD